MGHFLRGSLVSSRSLASPARGFIIVLSLMVALFGLSLERMASLQERVTDIAEIESVKADSIRTMRGAARERSVALLVFAVSDDVFVRDEAVTAFRTSTSEFLSARNQLMRSPLTSEERQMLDRYLHLSDATGPSQRAVLALFQQGEFETGIEQLLHDAIPKQNDALDALDALLDHIMTTTQAVSSTSQSQYAATVFWMLLLGLGAIAFASATAWVVTRGSRDREADLHHEKEKAQITLQAIADAVITTDREGRVEYLNPVAETLTGWPLSDAKGQLFDQVVNLRSGSLVASKDAVDPLDGPSSPLHETMTLVSRSGQESQIEEVSSPIKDRSGVTVGSAIILRDVTRSHRMARELTWSATHDHLTGLPNRVEFERRLEYLVEHARLEGVEHALLYLDLDQFKLVNDTCGHPAGDALLEQLSDTLRNILRSSDTLARLGGDEFGVLLPTCDITQAEQIADKLRSAISESRFEWGRRRFSVGVSIGVTPIPGDDFDSAQCMSKADAACYIAKEAGRNRIHVNTKDDQNLTYCEDHMHCLQEVSEALEANRFWLYGQHICPISKKKGGFTEILVRMINSDDEMVSPGVFIPAAERFGMMPSIDRWVIRRTLLRMSQPGPLSQGNYSINLSGQSLCDNEMLPYINECLNRTGVDPTRICFEITETSAIANLDSAGAMIDALRARGCRFALDDFGTGMSSFGYLRDLNVDFLKIDGSFIKRMSEDPYSLAMIESIHHIGSVMNLETVAEFVTDASLVLKLREIGVDYGQGFGLHSPEPMEPRPTDPKKPVWEREAAFEAD
ncbi:EAL domain-containing protein [Thioalkalivibrio sp. ALE16]|uniref:EAL domain-containing protein n=1 Tax=Thioalkalivibrio sp. ALE16 TaxID=1158172 RepID=UPI00037F7F05|nr:EAL domain-containing protein [Thioalkalivibrio sp. ALE16]